MSSLLWSKKAEKRSGRSRTRRSLDQEAFGSKNDNLPPALLNYALAFPLLQLSAGCKSTDIRKASKLLIQDCNFRSVVSHMAGSPRELEQGIRQALLSGFCSQSNQSLRIGGQTVQDDM